MRSFYDDTDYARSTSSRIASYSVSLLDTGKSSRMACYTLSSVGALSCKLTPAPVWREASSTLRIHHRRYPGPHPAGVLMLKTLPIPTPSTPSEVYTGYRTRLAQSFTRPSFLVGQACV